MIIGLDCGLSPASLESMLTYLTMFTKENQIEKKIIRHAKT